MNDTLGVLTHEASRAGDPGLVDRACRRGVLALLGRMDTGQIVLEDGGDRQVLGAAPVDSDLRATVRVNSDSFYRALALGGSVGVAEAYMDGVWTCSDLTALIRIIVRNRAVLEGTDRGWAALAQAALMRFHRQRKNTLNGSRRNISDHYDLSNDFFSLFLDPTMTYSSGIFEHPQSTLEEASIAKYDAICRKLEIGPEDHVLEIGTGWGGFAIHAAREYGCRVTTTTISGRQFELAEQRARDAGLGDRVTLLLEDYRQLSGRYDKLVSIEMIEAVGHEYMGQFVQTCSDRLEKNGMALIQAITIADQHYDHARRCVDFIKRFIFPGCCIPSVSRICEAIASNGDLRLFHLEDMTPHYAETLRAWRGNFFRHIDEVRALGYDDRFIRMWEYYLCYCEGAFRERYTGSVQLLLTKPLCRRASFIGGLDPASPRN